MPDDDRRGETGLLGCGVHLCGEDGEVVGALVGRLAVSGQVERDDPAIGVDLLQLGHDASPHGAVESQAVEEQERRAVVVAAPLVGAESGEADRGAVWLVVWMMVMVFPPRWWYHLEGVNQPRTIVGRRRDVRLEHPAGGTAGRRLIATGPSGADGRIQVGRGQRRFALIWLDGGSQRTGHVDPAPVRPRPTFAGCETPRPVARPELAQQRRTLGPRPAFARASIASRASASSSSASSASRFRYAARARLVENRLSLCRPTRPAPPAARSVERMSCPGAAQQHPEIVHAAAVRQPRAARHRRAVPSRPRRSGATTRPVFGVRDASSSGQSELPGQLGGAPAVAGGPRVVAERTAGRQGVGQRAEGEGQERPRPDPLGQLGCTGQPADRLVGPAERSGEKPEPVVDRTQRRVGARRTSPAVPIACEGVDQVRRGVARTAVLAATSASSAAAPSQRGPEPARRRGRARSSSSRASWCDRSAAARSHRGVVEVARDATFEVPQQVDVGGPAVARPSPRSPAIPLRNVPTSRSVSGSPACPTLRLDAIGQPPSIVEAAAQRREHGVPGERHHLVPGVAEALRAWLAKAASTDSRLVDPGQLHQGDEPPEQAAPFALQVGRLPGQVDDLGRRVEPVMSALRVPEGV